MKKNVVILQHRLLHYREDFFEKLKKKCEESFIELHLVHGQASARERIRKDEGNIKWADKVTNYYLKVGNSDLLWQPFPMKLRNADLIVIMQENRIISNYLIFFIKKIFPGKVAYWGHGANFQSNSPKGLREKWKSYLINKVDWWFAYTQVTVDILKGTGFPVDNITNLNNSVDTKQFVEDYGSITDIEACKLKEDMSIPIESKVGVFCGSLYKDKKLDLLLTASERVRKTIDFHLIIIGSGEELNKLKDYALTNHWVHLVGMKKGYDKALYYKISDIMLNPGALGLHILDSFSIGIPLVSTINARHGPEIAYIDNNNNAVLTTDKPDSHANTILKLLTDQSYYDFVKNNAVTSGEFYSIDNMVDNFFNGIKKSLD